VEWSGVQYGLYLSRDERVHERLSGAHSKGWVFHEQPLHEVQAHRRE
jgi:hypothetical protein